METTGNRKLHCVPGHQMDSSSASSCQSQLDSLTKRVEELEREKRLLISWMLECSCCSSKVAVGSFTTNIPESFSFRFFPRVVDACCDKTDQISPGAAAHGNSLQAFNSRELANKTEKPSGASSSQVNPIEEDAERATNMDCKPVCSLESGQKEELSGCNLRTMNRVNKRLIALKVMYFGQRFYGFASEAHTDPTIESEIFKALEKAKLLVSNRESLSYSRCGRTDKGVSSTGQVISLFVRSNCKDACVSQVRCEKEIDYVKVLNRALPKDIRVMGWSPVPPSFHSRFNCLGREYKYFFWKGKLNIEAMQTAGKKFLGEHDFRNFCKMDAANVSNYMRQITHFDISFCSRRSDDDELCAMTIKGSAFLWHQVRCMVAVLFMIGQGLESPNVIDVLLDTSKIHRKPQYNMAPDMPLVLRACEFEDVHFSCSYVAWRSLVDDMSNMVKAYILQAAIFHEALNLLPIPGEVQSRKDNKKGCHVPLIMRPTEPSYDERRAKLVMKGNIRKNASQSNEVS